MRRLLPGLGESRSSGSCARLAGTAAGCSLLLAVATGLAATAVRPSAAESLPTPPLSGAERGAVVTLASDGSVRWRAEWTGEATVVDGAPAARLTEAGRGHYGAFGQEVTWTVEAIWRAGERFAPLRIERTVRDVDGRLLMRERKTFDAAAGVARVERQDAIGRTSLARTIEVPGDTLAVEGIATALRALPFDPPRPVEAHLLTAEPKLYEVTLVPRGRERISTPAGTFDCYKVELVPHLGFLGVLRPFVPKTYFWFAVDPPHFWVRYEGLESGLGSPRVVMDLARLDRRGAGSSPGSPHGADAGRGG